MSWQSFHYLQYPPARWRIVFKCDECVKAFRGKSFSLCLQRFDWLMRCHIVDDTLGRAIHLQWDGDIRHTQVAHFVHGHANSGGLFGHLRVVRFSFCKNLVKAWDPYCMVVIFASRKCSRISENSRNSRKFPARENLLFYSTQKVKKVKKIEMSHWW